VGCGAQEFQRAPSQASVNCAGANRHRPKLTVKKGRPHAAFCRRFTLVINIKNLIGKPYLAKRHIESASPPDRHGRRDTPQLQAGGSGAA